MYPGPRRVTEPFQHRDNDNATTTTRQKIKPMATSNHFLVLKDCQVVATVVASAQFWSTSLGDYSSEVPLSKVSTCTVL